MILNTTTTAAPWFNLSAYGGNEFHVEIFYDRKVGTLANCRVIINGSVARGTLNLMHYGLSTHDEEGKVLHDGILCDGYLVDISGNSFDGPTIIITKSE